MHLRNHVVLAVATASFVALGGEVPAHEPPEGWNRSPSAEMGVMYASTDRSEALWLSPLVTISGDLEKVLSDIKGWQVIQKSPAMHWERDGVRGVMRQDVVNLKGRRVYRLGAVMARGAQGVAAFLVSQRSIQETKALFVPFLDSVQLPDAGASAAPSNPRFESVPSQRLPLAEVVETVPLAVSLAGDWVFANGISLETLVRRTPTHDIVRVQESGWGIMYSFQADGTYAILYMTHTAQGMAGTVDERGRWRLAGETVELMPGSSKLVITEANAEPWVKEDRAVPARALAVQSVRLSGVRIGDRPARENGGIRLEGACAPWFVECDADSGRTTAHVLQRVR